MPRRLAAKDASSKTRRLCHEPPPPPPIPPPPIGAICGFLVTSYTVTLYGSDQMWDGFAAFNEDLNRWEVIVSPMQPPPAPQNTFWLLFENGGTAWLLIEPRPVDQWRMAEPVQYDDLGCVWLDPEPPYAWAALRMWFGSAPPWTAHALHLITATGYGP